MARRSKGALLGIFREPEEVASAHEQLRAAGYPARSMEILSGTPYPAGAFGEEPERHYLYAFTLAGAACGFVVGLLVTISTQISTPLITYGMPILAIPPMINVLFEGTMLGAIIFTVIGVVFESRLPDLDPSLYDPRINEGYLGLVVSDGERRQSTAELLLRNCGAIDIIRGDAE